MLTFLIGLLFLCLLVVFHELGHFLAAKSFGIRVERFSVGFGKPLVEYRHGETVYAVASVPLGGFVKMAGESLEEPSTGAPDEFIAKPWWQRFVVVTAGPIANLIFALFANSLIGVVGIDVPLQPAQVESVGETALRAGFQPGDRIVAVGEQEVDTWYGLQVALADSDDNEPVSFTVRRREGGEEILQLPSSAVGEAIADLVPRADTRVGDVRVGMPAYQAGMRAGDRVVAVDGVPVDSWNEMREAIASRPEEELTVTVERDGTVLDVGLRTMAQEMPDGETVGVIGIALDVPHMRQTQPLGASIADGLTRTIEMTKAVYGGFWMMVSRPDSIKDNVAGPITIAQLAGSSTRPSEILHLLAFISIALMALNLLPIPILDGGHAMFCLIEGVRGRRLSLRSQLALQRVGLVVIGSLVIMAVFNDVKRVVERSQAVHRLESQETTEGP